MKKAVLIIMMICLSGIYAVAGDLTTDGLTVNSNATFYGTVEIKTYNLSSLTNGLVLYYNFETNEPVTVTDQSWTGNSGANNGCTWTNAGITNGAYKFDGSTNRISIISAIGMPRGNSNRTMVAWFKTTSSSGQKMLIAYGGQNVNLACGLAVYNGKLQFTGWANDMSGTITVSDGQWHMAALVHSSSGGRTLYVDGAADGTDTDSLNTSTGSVFVGRWTQDNAYFQGTQDEVRVYNRDLSAAEIKYLYNSYVGTNNTTSASLAVERLSITNAISQNSLSATNTLMGKLAIGTNSTTSALDVNGDTIIRSNLTVNGTANLTATNSTALGGVSSAEYLKRDGSVAMTANLNLATNLIQYVATPVSAGDAATKAYVDGATNGLLKADGTIPLTGNLKMNGKWLSNDGDNEGIFVTGDGEVCVNDTSASWGSDFWVNGSGGFSGILAAGAISCGAASSQGSVSFAQGWFTEANGTASFAAGANCVAQHDYSYVWSDGSETNGIPITSPCANSFTIYASGGIKLLGSAVEIEGSTNDLTMGIYTNR